MMKMVCDKCGREYCVDKIDLISCKDDSGDFVNIESEYVLERPLHEEFLDRQLCYDCYLSFINWLKIGDV